VNPISVNQTQLNYRFRFHSSVDETTRLEFIETIKKITEEDLSICELVQKNLEAGIYQGGILNPDRENGVEYFQKLVRHAVEKLLL
jgi:choline monooxygenase